MGTVSPFLAAFDGKRGELDEMPCLNEGFLVLDAVKLGVALGLGALVGAVLGLDGMKGFA